MDKGVVGLLEHDTVASISKTHQRSESINIQYHIIAVPLITQPPSHKAPAQVLLRWATQRGIAVIPKTNDAGRLKANLACCDFDLAESEIKQLNSLNIGLRVRIDTSALNAYTYFKYLLFTTRS